MFSFGWLLGLLPYLLIGIFILPQLTGLFPTV